MNANFNFYDIESLNNVFTLANYKPNENCIDLYYLIDNAPSLIANGKVQFPKDVKREVLAQNKNFNGEVYLFDLREKEANERLYETFGLSDAFYVNNPKSKSSYPDRYRLVCDTDPDYDDTIHPYFVGYNSYHYDTTMLAMYMVMTCDPKNGTCSVFPTSAKAMRRFNDELFTPQFNNCMEDRLKYEYIDVSNPARGFGEKIHKSRPATIRKNMLMSGRHLDAARINEKQQHVGLKRLLGMLGYQILESDKLSIGQNTIETYEQLLDLIAYNVSDTVNLEKLFSHKAYQSSFILKKQLLKDYPQIIYEQKKGSYDADISQATVRYDRLVIDSSSAQFATKALCPYGHLHDYDTVSFVYPSKDLIKAKIAEGDHSFDNVKPVNVLDEAKTFFYKNFSQPELRTRFDEIYNYYKSIEGKNFNESKNYMEDHGINEYDDVDSLPDNLKVHNLKDIPTPNTCMFYYNADGTPSNCFVNFSTGGIHGAEYNKTLFDSDMEDYNVKLEEYKQKCNLLEEVKAIYPDPRDLKRNKGIEINGVRYTPGKFLKKNATVDNAAYIDPPKPPVEPEIFKETKGKWNLNDRYTYTSATITQHEDFTSYYPNLLRMMRAFWNDGLGYDRYGEIFDQKTEFGHKMKDKSFPEETRSLYSVMRNGTKLILNSASGAGDAKFESNIRMNNKIISMRIIGQIFTWRIGQAQTLKGAHIPSTNTDGLYSAGLMAEINDEILRNESREINVEIEPETTYLISKDSNNRMEIEVTDDGNLGKVEAANGATLSCQKGVTPTQSLDHPAIIDWVLSEYLILAATNYKGLSLDKPFDKEIGISILNSARKQLNDDLKVLTMFQNVLASAPSKRRFIFAYGSQGELQPLQHYNRCFIVKDDTPGSVLLQRAIAKVITDKVRDKRIKNGEFMQQHNPDALKILEANHIDITTLELDKEAALEKIKGIDENWHIYINNHDLHLLSENEIENIFNMLDYEKYIQIAEDSYNKQWLNMTREYEIAKKLDKKSKTSKSAADDIETNVQEENDE